MKFKCALLILTMFQALGCDVNGKYLDSNTLHVGFNGLSEGYKIQFFEDRKTIENSWLKNALAPSELSRLIDQVDFKKQFILIYSFGKYYNANGKITMNSIKATSDSRYKITSIATIKKISVQFGKDCNFGANIESYPFIVESIERPNDGFKLIGGSDGNYQFDGGCTPPYSG